MSYTACYKCTERHLYCHQTCEKYLEEKRRYSETKEMIDKKRKKMHDADSFKKEAMARIVRKRKRK